MRNHQIKHQYQTLVPMSLTCIYTIRIRTPIAKRLFIFHMDCGLFRSPLQQNKSKIAIEPEFQPEISVYKMKCSWILHVQRAI